MNGTRLIVFNSGLLYIKTAVVTILALFSTRLILVALGVEDYGVYSLIAGVVALLSFLSASLSASTQRFISFNLGAGESDSLNIIFNTSVLLHFVLAIIIGILLEVIGVYLFENVLNINEDRLWVAKIIYHLVVVETFFSIASVPFTALINSYEDFYITITLDIIAALMRLLIALYLTNYDADRLLLFGILSTITVVTIILIKNLWSYIKYPIIKYNLRLYFCKKSLVKMTSFAGWNSFGSLCNISKNQGVSIVLNFFYGTIINASYGIANLVNSLLISLTSSIIQAFNPQILKNEGSERRNSMIALANTANRFSFLILALISVPMFVEMPFILKLWLTNVPENTVVFTRLIISITLVNQLGSGLPIILQAVGEIKWYQIIVGSLILTIIPIGYFILKIGQPAYSILVVALIIEFFALAARFYFSNLYSGLNLNTYLKEVVYKVLPPLVLGFSVAILPKLFLESNLVRFIITGFVSVVTMSLIILRFSLYDEEKNKMFRELRIIKNRILQRF